ncbi:hypothetical protein A2Y85_00875 [candidate division WOR-3 bacterium RBG_13_43_14]|uniref:SMP-30/Gluconolactonase/LRE-like region domain-containing protein n=1 Tax=candidate division WOR-3 bacterium RBG_13_43_14 TaxID=1802590 RepID=A0A1F4UDE1_UNCW3|nr:MAG: hypothetical protein A2Y85_00875 [candidate division WOR-3 bacterium RBG_13_43_14]
MRLKWVLMILVCLMLVSSFGHSIGERLWLRTHSVQGNYGLTYDPTIDRIYFVKFYTRYIYIVSTDSFCTSYGTIPTPNNDSACVDIKYCAYDNTFWVLSKINFRVYKINHSGTVLRYFTCPANDYPAGLAWDETNRQLYITDRRTVGGAQGYIYVCDTLGNQIRVMNHPGTAWYGPRGLAWQPAVGGEGPYLLNVYTFFNSSSALDSAGVFKLDPQTGSAVDFFRYCHPSNDSSNIRGVEVDPRDGSYWINLFQYGT